MASTGRAKLARPIPITAARSTTACTSQIDTRATMTGSSPSLRRLRRYLYQRRALRNPCVCGGHKLAVGRCAFGSNCRAALWLTLFIDRWMRTRGMRTY